MLPVYYLDYTNELDFKVTRFVNDTLISALTFLVESECTEHLFPKGCLRNESFNSDRKIAEITEVLEDDILRVRQCMLSPVNESIIYTLVSTIIEMKNDESNSYEINVPDKLKLEITECENYYSYKEVENSDEEIRYNFILESIVDWNEYLSFLFEDWDFKKNVVNKVTSCFLWNTEKFELLDFDLEYLIKSQELMSDDLYYKFKEQINMQRKSEVSSIQNITNSIDVQNNMQDNACIGSQVNNKKLSEVNSDKKKGFFERHGLFAAVIGAIAVIIAAVITIIYG